MSDLRGPILWRDGHPRVIGEHLSIDEPVPQPREITLLRNGWARVEWEDNKATMHPPAAFFYIDAWAVRREP